MRTNILTPIMIFMTRYYNILRNTSRKFSVSILLKIFGFSLITGLVLITGSCEKQVLKIGSDLLPNGDFVSIHSSDTIRAYSYTMYNDSIRTDSPSTSYLGQIFDPYFGTTTAGFVTQIRLGNAFDGVPITVDSVKLVLKVLSKNGGTSGINHSISFYEISDQIYNDTSYYSNTRLNLTKFKLTNILLPAFKVDTAFAVTLPGNGIEFGNYLMRDTSMLFYSNSLPDFRSYFKGLYFEMDPSSDPMLISLSLLSDQTSYYNFFTLYGHAADGTSKQYSFILDSKNANASYNRFTHDYSTATIGDKLIHRNTTYRDTVSYLQSLNGVYTKISLPGLEKLKSDKTLASMAINRARLVVPFKFTKTAGTYYATSLPLTLRLRYKLSSGSRYDVPDYLMAPSLDLAHTFFSGAIDSVNNVYNFNIPAFVQGYLKDATNTVRPEVEIYQADGLKNIVFKANNNKSPVKFEFTYTKF
jgi:hypothetical protein